MEIKVDSATATALEVPLREPFTIATARMETTRAALLRIRAGETVGLGEAACLYPVTDEDMPDVLALAARSFRTLEGRTVARIADCRDLAHEVSERSKVTASALECALLDALARSRGASIAELFGVGTFASRIESDITIPIAETTEMLRVGEVWHAQGFRAFKAKVGRDVDPHLHLEGREALRPPARRELAHRRDRHPHGGQRRMREAGRQDVVEPHDGHIAGHVEPGLAQHGEQALRQPVEGMGEQQQAQDAARSFESAVNEAGRSVEAEAASVQGSVNTSLAEAEANATKSVENSIAPASNATLTAQDEVQALEKSIAEQAQPASAATSSAPVITAEQMSATLNPSDNVSKKVA